MPDLLHLSLPRRGASLTYARLIPWVYVLFLFFIFSFPSHLNAYTKQDVKNTIKENSESVTSEILLSATKQKEEHSTDVQPSKLNQLSEQKSLGSNEGVTKGKLTNNINDQNSVSGAVVTKKQLGIGAGEWLRMIVSLLFIIALILGFAWAVNKLQIKTLPKGDDIQVISSVTLGGKERLLKIEVDEKRYLIAISPSGIQKIAELGDQKNNGQTET